MVGAMFAPTNLINRPLASLLALKRAAHIWVKFNNGTFALFMKGEGKVNTLPSPCSLCRVGDGLLATEGSLRGGKAGYRHTVRGTRDVAQADLMAEADR